MKKYLLILVGICGYLLPYTVKAETIVSQVVYSDSYTNSTLNSAMMQSIGNGFVTPISSFAIYAAGEYRYSGLGLSARIIACTRNDFAWCASNGTVYAGNAVTLATSTPTLALYDITTFDPTGYYLFIYTNGNGNQQTTKLYGSNTDLYAAGTCNVGSVSTSTCSSLSDIAFYIYGEGTTTLPITTSQISTTTPAINSTTATSSVFYFAFGGNVAGEDWDNDTNLYFRARQITGFDKWGNGPLGEYIEKTLDISSPGSFSVSTTTALLHAGDWQVYAAIQKPKYSIFGIVIPFFTETIASFTYTFIAATTTESDHAAAQILFSTSGFLTTASSTESTIACHIGLDFDIKTCLYYLVIPSGGQMKDYVDGFTGQWTAKFPFGLARRGIEIFTATTTEALPSLVITLPSHGALSSIPGGGASIDLTPWDKLLGSSSMLGTTEDTENGQTLREIVEPGWNLFVKILFGLMVVMELLSFTSRVHINAPHSRYEQREKQT